MTNLEQIKRAITALTEDVWRYHAPPKSKLPYIVWGEDGANHFQADNKNKETSYTGTIDLYTRNQDDPLMERIPKALNDTEAAWYLNSVQYEEETQIIHYEWVWEI